MPTDWYAPNQQAVRPDQSGPAEEGEGGSTHAAEPTPAAESKAKPKAEPEPEDEAA